MAQPPAVVIIARHGPRLDAADQSWHLSTPTPYDPPLTYGGWNQSRSLGIRIASLLHAREQKLNEESNEPPKTEGVKSHDFARQDGGSARRYSASEQRPRKAKRKHKVVIHTSPFLRCLQTSVAIAAGMAQFQAPEEAASRSNTTSARPRSSRQMHSGSPRLRGAEGPSSPTLAPIPEPKHDLAHTIARKVLSERRRHRTAKLRVDAFLGEWLNPQYFDLITPPPPSAMMVAAAKAELLQNETIDIFTPTVSTKSSTGSLWGGADGQKSGSKDSVLEDMNPLEDALPAGTHRRDRSSSVSSVGSNDSGSGGRRSPFRPGHVLQPSISTVPKPETTVYAAPTPQYAVSSADHIPRGYVAHARQACTNIDYQWDSSREPQDWGDGGEYGEEWSAMHKRFRKGLNHLISWYSQHNADDRAEDALGFDQAEKERHHEDEEEDLVVILVTHGAGSNALIGALTGQPVLLDVGMASLTMAVRKDNAPPVTAQASSNVENTSPRSSITADTQAHARKESLDLGLNAVYEMQLISSSEHLRPGADPAKAPSTSLPKNLRTAASAVPQYRQRFGSESHAAAGAGIKSDWNLDEPARRGSTNSNLGSMRRPPMSSPSASMPGPGKDYVLPTLAQNGDTIDAGRKGSGLWTPPAAKTPQATAQKMKEERTSIFSSLNENTGRVSPGRDLVLDFTTSPPDSRPASSGGPPKEPVATEPREIPQRNVSAVAVDPPPANGNSDRRDSIPKPGTSPPSPLSRSMSQRGLWGNKPAGDQVARRFPQEPKRRWTVTEKNGATS